MSRRPGRDGRRLHDGGGGTSVFLQHRRRRVHGGQCHGTLRFDTDHQELRAGQTTHEVLHGDDPENCIACHSPTAVLANGGMTEEEALACFFTTEDGKFTANTTVAHSAEWPHVACNACHDQHAPGPTPSFFNSTTRQFEPVASGEDLCKKCHEATFSNPDHPLTAGKQIDHSRVSSG